MMRMYWSVEIVHEKKEDSSDDDFLYYGCDVNGVYKAIVDKIGSKTAAYEIIGESIVTGKSEYMYKWGSRDHIKTETWEELDGTDEDIDD